MEQWNWASCRVIESKVNLHAIRNFSQLAYGTATLASGRYVELQETSGAAYGKLALSHSPTVEYTRTYTYVYSVYMYMCAAFVVSIKAKQLNCNWYRISLGGAARCLLLAARCLLLHDTRYKSQLLMHVCSHVLRFIDSISICTFATKYLHN